MSLSLCHVPAMHMRGENDGMQSVISSGTTPLYYPSGYLDEFQQQWFGKHLAAMKEPVLTPAGKDKNYFAFRILYLPTFTEPLAIRVEKNGGKIIRRTVKLSGAGGYDPGEIKEDKQENLAAETFARINDGISRCAFDRMRAHDNELGHDGSMLIVEYIREGKYSLVVRWTPQSSTRKRGLCSVLALVTEFFQEAGFWRKNDCSISKNAPMRSVEDIPSKLHVEKLDFEIPKDPMAEEKSMQERFITNQQERYAIMLPLDSWEQSWDLLAGRLVEEAKTKNLDSQQLASCLRKIKARSENASEGMIDLPVGAYLARHAKGECWIIVAQWGIIKDDNAKNCSLGHLGAWAMDIASGYYIAWATCN
ncbi:MAG: hypothetical protein LBM92_06340 [Opitutaceae bacterium]|nr:hypothetical protein [Opitutaceae bacterium]